VDMSTALAADLARLTEALDDPGVVDLPALLGRCHDALLAAVPSGLGLSMTFPAGPGGVTVSTLPAAGTAIRSSLRVPMTSWADVDPRSDVVFYAATAGALVDLAADLGWALQLPGDGLLIDRDLSPEDRGRSGLWELSVVHRAVGVLLDRGRTPHAARDELDRAARDSNTSVAVVADRLIRSLNPPPTPAGAETAAVDFGVPGVDVEPGDHICALYRGAAERDALLLPFLRAGLRDGDTCLCLIDRIEPDALIDRLSGGVDARAFLDTHQLEVDRAADVYLPAGRFSAEDMIGFLSDTITTATTAGRCGPFRAAGEMSWMRSGTPGADEFFGYESAVNRVAAHHPAVLLCLYDLNDLGDDMLINVLKTHPRVLRDGEIRASPHYLTPNEYQAAP
jgi:hypothetical protein